MSGEQVRKVRKRLGLSQADFGKLLGVTYVTVSRWETGAVRITEPMGRLIKLVAARPTGRKGR